MWRSKSPVTATLTMINALSAFHLLSLFDCPHSGCNNTVDICAYLVSVCDLLTTKCVLAVDMLVHVINN
jgi:hypothetical protein